MKNVFTAAEMPAISSISCSFTLVHLLIIHRHAVTCISSSLDWMSGGKSAAPQVNGSNGSAPNMSLPKEEEEEGLFFPSFYMPLKLTSTIYDSKKTAYATRPYG